jgi:hypothetical protein
MRAIKVLHKLLRQAVPSIHLARLNVLMAAIESIANGACLHVTAIGRGLDGNAYQKHKIKRADRLLSNKHLYRERVPIYSAITQFLLKDILQPIILVDWSPMSPDQRTQLLRAALPVGGRSLTLYEEIHPREKLGNRRIQHRFLKRLSTMLPENCRPIIVADSGFKTPFYRYIESQLNWHWVGRIRGRDKLRLECNDSIWFGAKTLYQKATKKEKLLGDIKWTQSHSLQAFIVLVRQPKKHRKSLTYQGVKRRSKRSKVHASREREPWLLVASRSLRDLAPKAIVKIYGTRMQIELGFRDCKSPNYGLGLSQRVRMNKTRRAVLCLLAACSTFLLWCIGNAIQNNPEVNKLKVNSSSRKNVYSVIHLARLALKYGSFSISEKQLLLSVNSAVRYIQNFT